MKRTVDFALSLLVGAAFIYLVAALYEGQPDARLWSQGVRHTASFFVAAWGFLILSGSDA
jgi:hypothetical protein